MHVPAHREAHRAPSVGGLRSRGGAQLGNDGPRGGGAEVLVGDRRLLDMPHAAHLRERRRHDLFVDGRERHAAAQRVHGELRSLFRVTLQQVEEIEACQRGVPRSLGEEPAIVGAGARHRLVGGSREAPRAFLHGLGQLRVKRCSDRCKVVADVVLRHVARAQCRDGPGRVSAVELRTVAGDGLDKLREPRRGLGLPDAPSTRTVTLVHGGVAIEVRVHRQVGQAAAQLVEFRGVLAREWVHCGGIRVALRAGFARALARSQGGGDPAGEPRTSVMPVQPR